MFKFAVMKLYSKRIVSFYLYMFINQRDDRPPLAPSTISASVGFSGFHDILDHHGRLFYVRGKVSAYGMYR
jgi:hypothetical protein